jgi:2-oxoglutarate dehydrogenase E1 component
MSEVVRMNDKQQVLDPFRRRGYLHAILDPLGRQHPGPYPDLQLGGEFAELGRRWYCGMIGAEFMHITNQDLRAWIQERMESDPMQPDRREILRQLIDAEVFEEVLQSHYPGTKRFSLEGIAALIPLLTEVLEGSAACGVTEAVIGMSHRGRLNVLVQIVGKSPVDIIGEFEDVDPRSVLGGGDVKYHIGATGIFTTRNRTPMQIRVVSGPSHLEAVDPVVLGRVRAKQVRAGADGQTKILPILIHGDAAFAGQGIAAETLNFATLDGYSVGGPIHIIANNLIGFTANPYELYSSRFSSDLAKRLEIPIFHVNGEDPEAVVRVGRMAADFRAKFSCGVLIDLIGFRRHGHSEIDDPTMTQPLLYGRIKNHPPLWRSYAEKIGASPETMAEATRARYERAHQEAAQVRTKPRLSVLPDYWTGYTGGAYDPSCEVDTGLTRERITEIVSLLNNLPAGFHVHPKVKRILERREAMARGERPVDFGFAETLAFASLLNQGVAIRLSGQDSCRGTFGQRHAVLVDTVSGEEFVPLSHLSPPASRFDVFNSMLSEAAVLGFEYGYSRESPDALVLWEAQFGDFVNGAQVIVDQFIAAGEDKWGLLAGLVLLLPHGYEGQGPEHSSARLERFLQLAAEDNFQVCQPSTSAQYFHLLRRQAMRHWRKPLIVMTPKSMLRQQDAGSALPELSRPRFLPVLPETEVASADRVIVCTGKIGRELRAERKRRGDKSTAIVFVEQLYPFPESELAAELRRHAGATNVIWVQEEPANMGALAFILPRLKELAGNRPVRSVRRKESASPATGSAKAHELEQQTILKLAFV